jgi:hypothetical protein
VVEWPPAANVRSLKAVLVGLSWQLPRTWSS